jgi:hypothetical protein
MIKEKRTSAAKLGPKALSTTMDEQSGFQHRVSRLSLIEHEVANRA